MTFGLKIYRGIFFREAINVSKKCHMVGWSTICPRKVKEPWELGKSFQNLQSFTRKMTLDVCERVGYLWRKVIQGKFWEVEGVGSWKR